MEQIPADGKFFNAFIDVQHFLVYAILPELIGKWYSLKPVEKKEGVVEIVPETLDESEIDNEEYNKMWCYCNTPSYGQVILCDNKSCPI